jgi:hypothetical protein
LDEKLTEQQVEEMCDNPEVYKFHSFVASLSPSPRENVWQSQHPAAECSHRYQRQI